jgi:hypothetical protein
MFCISKEAGSKDCAPPVICAAVFIARVFFSVGSVSLYIIRGLSFFQYLPIFATGSSI